MRKISLISSFFLSIYLGFSQQIGPAEFSHTHKGNYICSRSNNLTTQNKTISQRVQFSRNSTSNCMNSISDWTPYSGTTLVNKLKMTTDYECLRSLFTLDSPSASETIFSNENIQAVANEMLSISISHDGTINSGMYGLVVYLHAAIYQEFEHALVSLNSESKESFFTAMESFAGNEHLWNVNEIGLNILNEYLILCDYRGLRHKDKILAVVKDAMKKLITEDNWKPIANNPILIKQYTKVYNLIFTLFFRGIHNSDTIHSDTDYISAVHNDPELIELLYNLSKDEELSTNEHLELIMSNAFLELTRMASSSVLRPDVEEYIANLASSSTRLSAQWFHAIKTITKGGNCETYNLCEDIDAIEVEIRNILFPNTWTFEDGTLILKTPLSYDKAQNLYYAAKQVQSQFFRFLQTDTPVAEDSNSTLNMVVYGTLEEYKNWQSVLNGLSTDNGGIYIEKDATFYTYERTTDESIFSLEELFRHEYVHYLQGRYIENGLWGKTNFYKNDRLAWFDEGMAEHLAGSTHNDGVRIRQSMGNSLRLDGEDEYMTVSEILSSGYIQGFKFYRYGNMLWDYWFKEDITTARELINLVRTDNIQGYDTKIQQIKEDATLQTAYKNHLNNVVINPDNWWNVNTPWIEDNLFNISTLEDLKFEFNRITGIDAEISLEYSSSIRRFKATFPIVKTDDMSFDNELDRIMEQLKDNPLINNFYYTVGYYTNVNESSATAIITGPLLKLGVNNDPKAQFSANKTYIYRGNSIAFNNLSHGYVKDYEWSFPGGNPSNSTEKNPSIVYHSEGTYPVILKAKRDGIEDIEEVLSFIKVYDKSNLKSHCTASVAIDFAYISNVTFSDINNDSSGFPEDGYSDYTNLIAVVDAGSMPDFSVTLSQNAPNDQTKVWIDWNQDGDFNDENENVLSLQGAASSGSISVPESDYAANGVTRMRVRFASGKEPQKCGEDTFFGEVEDYSILVIGGTDDFDGDGVLNDVDQCPNTISGIEIDSMGCHLLKSSLDYCAATVLEDYEYISNVTFSNINNDSFEFPENGYSDYTNLLALVHTGSRSDFSVTLSDTDGDEQIKVWIDWNQDGDFQDENENVLSLQGATSSGSISIPESVHVTNGVTRMRVRFAYGKEPQKCGEDRYFGEVEDYSVLVVSDADGDGVFDSVDQCNNTPFGSAVNTFGCTLLSSNDSGIYDGNIKFYPNPIIDSFHIEGLKPSDITLQVFAYNGHLVYSKNHKPVNGIVYAPIGNLSTGLYMVKIHEKQTRDIINLKLIKK